MNPRGLCGARGRRRLIKMDLEPDTSLGRYQICSKIGTGGMGDVYVASDTLLGRKVALKILKPEFASDPERLARFEREVRTASALNHPNIITVFDVGEQTGTHFIVTELIDGETLRAWVSSSHPSIADLADACRQAALALGAAHAAGIIHRDIKPENLMRRKDGLVKVLDFGVSKVISAGSSTSAVTCATPDTMPGALIGTARYMSPEQALCGPVDGRADIWSLGVVLYELVSGTPPFDKDSLAATLVEIVSGQPRPLSELVPDAPDNLCRIVERAMKKDREERFHTADDMAECLDAVTNAVVAKREAATIVLQPGQETRKGVAYGLLDAGVAGIAGTPASPATPVAAPPNNLPSARTKFIGRERELAEVTVRLVDPLERLLTLTGPGGTGKTRLAIETAREFLASGRFPDGVLFVDLSPISEPGLISRSIAGVLGVVSARGTPLEEAIKQEIRDKHMLLVLDNFEHLLDGAMIVSDMLAASAGLKVLATSRAPLRLSLESEYPVEPLEVPSSTGPTTPDEMASIAAIVLFIERARQARPDFDLTATNAAAVAEICRKLEGLPLAIELAAARIKVLTPSQIAERLKDRLKLLTGGARDLPGRQQTMRGAIEWSYDLLDEKQRGVLRRLAVFAGGCTLDAVESVCRPDSEEALGSLIENSLVKQREQEDGQARYTLLEVVREFANEKLQESGESDEVRLGFARYFKRVVETADSDIRSGNQVRSVRRLFREHENVKAALTVLQDKEPREGAAFVGSIQSYLSAQGYGDAERREWLIKALTAPDLPPNLRARLLNGLTRCEVHLGQTDAAVNRGREAVEAARASGDRDVLGIALGGLGHALSIAGDLDGARDAFHESAGIGRELGSSHALSVALGSLGEVARMAGDLKAATKYYNDALEAAGRHARSNPNGIILANLGGVSLEQGDYSTAAAYYREALAIVSDLENGLWTGIALDGLAAVALHDGDAEKAAMLAGAAEALCERAGSPPERWEQELRARYVDRLRSTLDAEILDRQWQHGRALTLPEAAAAAV